MTILALIPFDVILKTLLGWHPIRAFPRANCCNQASSNTLIPDLRKSYPRGRTAIDKERRATDVVTCRALRSLRTERPAIGRGRTQKSSGAGQVTATPGCPRFAFALWTLTWDDPERLRRRRVARARNHNSKRPAHPFQAERRPKNRAAITAAPSLTTNPNTDNRFSVSQHRLALVTRRLRCRSNPAVTLVEGRQRYEPAL